MPPVWGVQVVFLSCHVGLVLSVKSATVGIPAQLVSFKVCYTAGCATPLCSRVADFLLVFDPAFGCSDSQAAYDSEQGGECGRVIMTAISPRRSVTATAVRVNRRRGRGAVFAVHSGFDCLC
jgi:hypothetical protein